MVWIVEEQCYCFDFVVVCLFVAVPLNSINTELECLFAGWLSFALCKRSWV